MERIEKALMAVCTAAIPCTLLLAAVSLLTDGERGIGIIALAFCFLLEFIKYLLPGIPALYQEDKKERKAEAVFPDIYIELEKRVQNLEYKIKRLESQVSLQKEEPEKWKKNLEKIPEETEKKGEYLKNKPVSVQKQDVQEFLISLDLAELENKKELTEGDRFPVYKNGKGKYKLNELGGLFPSFMKAGDIFTKEMYEIFKAQNMGKIFMLNSREVINHKILEITQAKIAVKNIDKADSRCYGTLVQKGRIIVE